MWLRPYQDRSPLINVSSFNNILIIEWAKKTCDHKKQEDTETTTGELLKVPLPLKVINI